jgi:hypothetical protein
MAARLKACPSETSPAVQQIEVAAEFLKKGNLSPRWRGKRIFCSGHPIAVQQHRIYQLISEHRRRITPRQSRFDVGAGLVTSQH